MGKKKMLKTAIARMMKAATLYRELCDKGESLEFPTGNLNDHDKVLDCMRYRVLAEGVFALSVYDSSNAVQRNTEQILMDVKDKYYMANVVNEIAREAFNNIVSYTCKKFIRSTELDCIAGRSINNVPAKRLIEFIWWVSAGRIDKKIQWLEELAKHDVIVTFKKIEPQIEVAGHRSTDYEGRVQFLKKSIDADITLMFSLYPNGEVIFWPIGEEVHLSLTPESTDDEQLASDTTKDSNIE